MPRVSLLPDSLRCREWRQVSQGSRNMYASDVLHVEVVTQNLHCHVPETTVENDLQPSTGVDYGGDGWVLASRLLVALAEQQQQLGQWMQVSCSAEP